MSDTTRPIVETNEGPVQGAAQEGAEVFRAIPYAEPPLGDLRWAPPVPAAERSRIHDAADRGAAAIQPPSRLARVMGEIDFVQSEDCLTLTVNRPATGGEKLPVMVWLHGGAFSSGGGDLAWYSGAALAQRGDAIVVGVNYRLGALGFLCHPAVSPGNLGLRDQVMALEWVRDNIAAFGGDPENVTVFGQSAGAWSIALHLTGDATSKLFHRAILQSMPFGAVPKSPEQAAKVAERFFTELGLDPDGSDLAARARAKSPAEVLAAQRVTAAWYAEAMPRAGSPAIAFQPVADVSFLPAVDDYPKAIHMGAERMDTIVGFTRDELVAFGTPLEPRREDTFFATPSIAWALHGAESGRKVFLYRFDWAAPDGGVGACHCVELPFLFDTRTTYEPGALMLKGGDPAEIDVLAAAMGSAWTTFARSGDLAGSALEHWPPLDPANPRAMVLDTSCQVVDAAGLATP